MGFFSTSGVIPYDSQACFLNLKLGHVIWAKNSVTFLWADGSEKIVVWTMKYRDDRIISLGYRDKKWYLKSELYSKTWDTCLLNNRLKLILEFKEQSSDHILGARWPANHSTTTFDFVKQTWACSGGSYRSNPIGRVRSGGVHASPPIAQVTDIFPQALHVCIIISIFLSAH